MDINGDSPDIYKSIAEIGTERLRKYIRRIAFKGSAIRILYFLMADNKRTQDNDSNILGSYTYILIDKDGSESLKCMGTVEVIDAAVANKNIDDLFAIDSSQFRSKHEFANNFVLLIKVNEDRNFRPILSFIPYKIVIRNSLGYDLYEHILSEDVCESIPATQS
ncbi:hypothetical protein ACFL1U_03535 [Patescibacteria group bacterium]